MRIGMVSTPFLPVPPGRYGGTELVVAALTEGLLARGHEVVLFAPGDSTLPGVELRSIYPESRWPVDATRELVHAAFAAQSILADRDLGLDLVHAHSAAFLPFARLLGLPVVYTVHHERLEPACELYRFVSSPELTMVCISARQRELLEDTCRARVVHHGLDVGRYPYTSGQGGYAAFLGRLSAEKGVHIALDAAAGAGLPLRLAGKPHVDDHGYFRTEVAPRLTRPGVAWLGEVGHEEKIELLGGALASLCPSAWEEPFGLVLIESMLVGTPVLTFPRGAAPELVEDGVTGWIVRDVDEMRERLRGLVSGELPFDRERCRARARERFSSGRMAEDYLSIYAEVAHHPGAPEGATWHGQV